MTNWASDENANALLKNILDETADDAAQEELRLLKSVLAKRAQADARLADQQAKKLADAGARISAEDERQSKQEQRRTAKIEALRIEDLKAAGDWVNPKIATDELAHEQIVRDHGPLEAPMLVAQSPTPSAKAEPAPVMHNPLRSWLHTIAAVAVAIIGTTALTIGISQHGYHVDQTSYAKTIYAPKNIHVGLLDQGFVILTTPDGVVTTPPAARRVRHQRPARVVKAKPRRNAISDAAAKHADELGKLLGQENDVFGTNKM